MTWNSSCSVPLNRSAHPFDDALPTTTVSLVDQFVSPVCGSSDSAANTSLFVSDTCLDLVVSPVCGSSSSATNTPSCVSPICGSSNSVTNTSSFVDSRARDLDARLGNSLHPVSQRTLVPVSRPPLDCSPSEIEYTFTRGDELKLSFMTDALKSEDPFTDKVNLASDVRLALDWVSSRSDACIMEQREAIICDIERIHAHTFFSFVLPRCLCSLVKQISSTSRGNELRVPVYACCEERASLI